MIKSKKELEFYIMADRIMNGFPSKAGFKDRIKMFFHPQRDIMRFLYYMRMRSYYSSNCPNALLCQYYRCRYIRLSRKLGFSIDYNVFGYGLVIPHYGTIVVGGPNRIGNYAVLHTSTCIAQGGKTIGDGLYLSSGSVITGACTLGDYVTVAPNSVVNKNFDSNIIIAGTPAVVKRINYPQWFERDGSVYLERFLRVESLKKQMNL